MSGPIEMRPVDGRDEHALGALAGALPPGDASRAVIEGWVHFAAAHPSGLRVWVAASGADSRGPERLAALVAARPVPARIDGGERLFSEVIGAFVHPLDRGTARSPRLLSALMAQFLEATNRPESDVIVYGSAGDAAWRTLRHGLEIEVLRRQPQLVAPVASSTEWPDGVERGNGFDARALPLYDRASAPWRASALRDEHTLGWRFPEAEPHLVLEVPSGGALDGLAVAQVVGERLLLLDWLVPEDAGDARELLWLGLEHLAREHNCAHIAADLPPWCADFARFQDRGYRVRPTEGFLLARSAHARLDVWWLRENWWFQPFDAARPNGA